MVCKSPFGDLYLMDEFFSVVVFSCIFKKIEEIEREFVPFVFVRVINFAGLGLGVPLLMVKANPVLMFPEVESLFSLSSALLTLQGSAILPFANCSFSFPNHVILLILQ